MECSAIIIALVHCVSKNDTDVAHYNFDANQPILIIFGGDVAERVYAIKGWFVIPRLLTSVSALPGETWIPEIVSFLVMLYTVSQKRNS